MSLTCKTKVTTPKANCFFYKVLHVQKAISRGKALKKWKAQFSKVKKYVLTLLNPTSDIVKPHESAATSCAGINTRLCDSGCI